MTVHHPIAASVPTPTPASRAIPSLSPVRGAEQANLPTWAQTSEARALIAAIKLERPLTKLADIGDPHPRYAGKNATRLRELFDRTFDLMTADLDKLRVPVAPGRSQPDTYWAAHDALVAWRKVNNSDALIARLIGDRA